MDYAKKIRVELLERDVRQFELARAVGVNEFTLSRRLRDGITQKTYEQYRALIDEIAESKKGGGHES